MVRPARVRTASSVLLDISILGMDGYEVASRLRSESEPETVTLVVVTEYGPAPGVADEAAVSITKALAGHFYLAGGYIAHADVLRVSVQDPGRLAPAPGEDPGPFGDLARPASGRASADGQVDEAGG